MCTVTQTINHAYAARQDHGNAEGDSGRGRGKEEAAGHGKIRLGAFRVISEGMWALHKPLLLLPEQIEQSKESNKKKIKKREEEQVSLALCLQGFVDCIS